MKRDLWLIVMKDLNGFLMTQRHAIVTFKDECGYVMLESFIVHACRSRTHVYVALS